MATRMQRIGRYEIETEIGRGAMGVVLRARDPAIGRMVAIKTIRLSDFSGWQDSARLAERLRHEARTAGILSHPGIVTIYDVGEDRDSAYIAMEYVNGPTLEQILSSPEPIRPELIFRVLREAAAALDFAHKKGIVHRDIKPANIMLHEDGTVKITDFGVARLPASQLATQTGAVVGTPSYMAPEQALGKPVDGRSDQFSLAVIAYELLTGEKPFSSENLAGLVYKIAHEDPAPPSRLNPTLGWQVDVVLGRALSKGPAGRFPSCTEFVEALEAAVKASRGFKPQARGALQNMPTVEVRPATAEREAYQAPASLRSSRRAIWLGSIVVLLAILAVAAVFLATRYRAEIPPPGVVDRTPPAPGVSFRPSPAGPAVAGVEKQPSSLPTEEEAKPSKEEEAPAPLTQPSHPVVRSRSGLPAEFTVLVRTTPPGAEIVIDANPLLSCTTPCSLQLPSGRHTLAANLDGHRTALRIFRLPEESNLYLYLTPLSGQIQVLSQPAGAAILVNGVRRPETTPATLQLPAGKHLITVVKEGYQQDQQEVELKDSAFVRLNFVLGQ